MEWNTYNKKANEDNKSDIISVIGHQKDVKQNAYTDQNAQINYQASERRQQSQWDSVSKVSRSQKVSSR